MLIRPKILRKITAQ
ncbi:hypothetical protein TSAR_015872 [Trichomalopsis sarcophagae]|uniref:Uncharacterized protein n=1 Tax=Trichomalopsis sarcophagae TaxID=543379 RepID=A0A232EJR0_9HYME|nr:hypothetical protein TSAR_015872 [Trichomalopsis sarcophagae]